MVDPSPVITPVQDTMQAAGLNPASFTSAFNALANPSTLSGLLRMLLDNLNTSEAAKEEERRKRMIMPGSGPTVGGQYPGFGAYVNKVANFYAGLNAQQKAAFPDPVGPNQANPLAPTYDDPNLPPILQQDPEQQFLHEAQLRAGLWKPRGGLDPDSK